MTVTFTESRPGEVLANRRIRHLPVTDTGCLVGIISVGDLLLFRLRELQPG